MPELLTLSPRARPDAPVAAEFFAGIGLARMGLEAAGFTVAWANDIEPDKRDMYVNHFKDPEGSNHFALGDIRDVAGAHLPKGLSLAWASFPCTDLSLAGWRRGLAGEHSSTFYAFMEVLADLGDASRPPVVALENVTGLATSHGGADLAAAIAALNDLGYSVDVLTLDARRFVPQSRPRLFLVGALNPPALQDELVSELRPEWLRGVFGNDTLRTHRAQLLPPPALWTAGLADEIEEMAADDARWWDDARRDRFLDSLSPFQAARLQQLQRSPRVSYRTAYRRTRNGIAMWEIRPDDISGCLRTAKGGSSKQAVVQAGDGHVRVRWMTAREYARLMGAPDYDLSGVRTNQALYGFGDAVCVPAIKWLADEYLLPLVRNAMQPVHSLALELANA